MSMHNLMGAKLRSFILLSLALLTSTASFAGINNIEEQDGSPSVYPWKLKVSNGTLTNNGDGTASLTTGGGGSGIAIGGAITSGTANRVLYENSGNTISEDADLQFDGTTLLANTVDINGGNIDGTKIGTSSAADATFSVIEAVRNYAGDGSAAVPSYSLANDRNTGLYGAAADTIGFANGGAVTAWMGTSYFTPLTNATIDLGFGNTLRWRDAYIGRQLIQLDNVSTGTTPQNGWIVQYASTALGSGAFSMYQATVDKDQTANLVMQPIFVDLNGDFTGGVHINGGAAANGAWPLIIGVHGTLQSGMLMDVDGTTATGINVYRNGSAATTGVVKLRANQDYATDGTAGAATAQNFTGNLLEFYNVASLTASVDYLGNFDINGGTIDGTRIGASSAADATFTNVIVNGAPSIVVDAQSTSTVSYIQYQNSTTGYTGTNDGLTVGANGLSGIVRMRDGSSTLGLGQGDTERVSINTTEVVINDDSSNYNTRIESDNNANALYVRATNDTVGVMNSAPVYTFDVTGSIRSTGTLVNTNTGSMGWSVVAAANQACTTTCTFGAVVGLDQGTLGAVLPSLVGTSDATADQCLCSGPS